MVEVKPFAWHAAKFHSQRSCVNVEKLDYLPISYRERLFVRLLLLSLRSPWNLPVHQTTKVFRFLPQNDRKLSHPRAFTSQVHRNGGLEEKAYAAYRSLGGFECELGFQERRQGKKTSRSGIPCTSSPPSWTFALPVCPSTLEATLMMSRPSSTSSTIHLRPNTGTNPGSC